jgi:hypothetical protein
MKTKFVNIILEDQATGDTKTRSVEVSYATYCSLKKMQESSLKIEENYNGNRYSWTIKSIKRY